MNVVQTNQYIAYMHHRCRVKYAKSVIDDAAPLLGTGNFARFTKMKEDVETIISRHRDNERLLVAMNRIVRTKGEIDSFRTPQNSYNPSYSKVLQKQQLLQAVDKENELIGKMIASAKTETKTWLEKIFQKEVVKKKPKEFQYPSLELQKYSKINLPTDISEAKKYLRPKIWFNLEIKGVHPLGRIFIELYTEAAPQVVMEFVRLCFAQQKERLQFIRLFPRLWLEGNLKLDERTLMTRNIEFDKRSLNHDEDMGIFSFNVKNVLCLPKSIINFSISFKPLRACNGRRVGFGRIYSGLRTLKSIEDYGNKNGKLYKEIIVTDCGLVK